MIALDTNILARYLLNDPPAQSDLAEKLLLGPEKCTAPITVFLELVWVLESCDCDRMAIIKSIRLLCGLENFKPQNLESLFYALSWYGDGMDFADAIHLALSLKESEFKTFDKSLTKKAYELALYPTVSTP